MHWYRGMGLPKRPVLSALLNVLRRRFAIHEGDTGAVREEEPDKDYQELRQQFLPERLPDERVFVIQPYVKWGVRKKRNTTAALQLAEAVALVGTLPNWIVVEKQCVPLLSLERRRVFGSGTFERLKQQSKGCRATSIFISTDTLKLDQLTELQREFNLTIYDRYSVVIHILRQHAKSPEAKLQVSLAELPYIRKKINQFALTSNGCMKLQQQEKRSTLERRAKKLEESLQRLERHRELIKSQRTSYGIPTVAMVGYTNAGKTSLVRALTGDASLKPRDALFATLDTTVHRGNLPSGLNVLYMDTIGFIQDVPETLIKPFLVTIQEALNADLILHVFDISHPDVRAQVSHVLKIMENLCKKKPTVINVANKCDTVPKVEPASFLSEEVLAVSAKKSIGTDLLRLEIEKKILSVTDHKRVRIRVKVGSVDEAWLYKETTVVNAKQDTENPEYSIFEVIATDVTLMKFKGFLRNKL